MCHACKGQPCLPKTQFSGFLKRRLPGLVPVPFFRPSFWHSCVWGRGCPGTVPLHNLRVTLHERRRNQIIRLPKFMLNLVFQACYRVFEVFQDTWRSNKENPSVCWTANLSLSFQGLKLCEFVSRSHLVLICISFPSRSGLVSGC